MKPLEVKHLTKTYSGKTAVNDLSFSAEEGEILGLIGPNGAGKSTTIKSVLGFLDADAGEISIFGDRMNERVKDQLGYMPEEKGLYKKISAIDLIVYLATLKGMVKSDALQRADELLEQVGMKDNKHMKIEEMSKGMGQLIQLIITIIHNPKLIILDEPFSGLDPVNTYLLKNIMADLKQQGKTIILSTHQMNEVEELSDRILMINKGNAVLYGSLTEIRSRYKGNSVFVDKSFQSEDIAGVIEKRTYKDSLELVLDGKTSTRKVLEQLMKKTIDITKFEVGAPTLNEIFIQIVNSYEK